MNFLQICQEVDKMAGTQGIFESVINPVGAHEVITTGVIAGFRDIQTDRLNWEWMLREKTHTFNIGTASYTIATLFGSQDDTASPYMTFGRWDKKNPNTSCYITNPDTGIVTRVRYLDYYAYREILKNASTATDLPKYYTCHPVTNTLTFYPSPDKLYTITVDYYVKPLLLSTNAQIPYLPVEHHNCISYKGLERVANHYGNMAIYDKYAGEAAVALGQLYRSYIPAQSAQLNPIA